MSDQKVPVKEELGKPYEYMGGDRGAAFHHRTLH